MRLQQPLTEIQFNVVCWMPDLHVDRVASVHSWRWSPVGVDHLHDHTISRSNWTQEMHTHINHRRGDLKLAIVAAIVAIASTAGILFDDLGLK